MSLADMLKLKQLANDFAFMRLFFLKPQTPVRNLEKSSLEIIDCVLAIFLFELTRVVRTGRTLYRRDQLQFQILHFFSNLKACRVKESGRQKAAGREQAAFDDQFDIEEDMEENDDSEGGSSSESEQQCLSQLISKLKVECEESIVHNLSAVAAGDKVDNARKFGAPDKCKNCQCEISESKAFVNLYKRLVEDVLKFQSE